MPSNKNRTNKIVSLALDPQAYRIWKSMPRGRRSGEVCKLIKGEGK